MSLILRFTQSPKQLNYNNPDIYSLRQDGMAKGNPSSALHRVNLRPGKDANVASLQKNIDYHNDDNYAVFSTAKQHTCGNEERRSLVSERELACQQSKESASKVSIVHTASQDQVWNELTTFEDDVNDIKVHNVAEDISSSSSGEQELENFSKVRRQRKGKPTRVSLTCLLPQRPTACQDVGYRGISANPPDITKCGIARGNTAQIHRKAWLEVTDPKHRYGKNLRLYHQYWESLGCPSDDFFKWLDSTPLPCLVACPREVLDNNTVLYITDPAVSDRYALQLVVCEKSGRCRVLDRQNKPVNTDREGWMFVLRDSTFYGAKKINGSTDGSKERFHHSSFFGGKAVKAAGIFLTDDEGFLTDLFPHSGHYRPGEADMQRILIFLHKIGVDLTTFLVDIQQLIRINRHEIKSSTNTAKEGDKKRKIESLFLRPAACVAHYLSHKARFIGDGILSQIQATRDPIRLKLVS